MITVWAGRFTPHAKVEVETKTWMWRSANKSSTRVRSTRFIPAWWIANPKGKSSFSSPEFFTFSVSDWRIVWLAEFSFKNLKLSNILLAEFVFCVCHFFQRLRHFYCFSSRMYKYNHLGFSCSLYYFFVHNFIS